MCICTVYIHMKTIYVWLALTGLRAAWEAEQLFDKVKEQKEVLDREAMTSPAKFITYNWWSEPASNFGFENETLPNSSQYSQFIVMFHDISWGNEGFSGGFGGFQFFPILCVKCQVASALAKAQACQAGCNCRNADFGFPESNGTQMVPCPGRPTTISSKSSDPEILPVARLWSVLKNI